MKRTTLSTLFVLPLLAILISSNKNKEASHEPSLEEVLVSKEWKIEEIRFLQDNVMYYYKRNNGGNINFDKDKIVFKADKTGTYWQDDYTSYNFIWGFTDSNKDKVMFTINYSSMPLTLTWENFTFTSTSLKYTEYYTHANGVKSLASVWRTAL